jgi:hypothetical protein
MKHRWSIAFAAAGALLVGGLVVTPAYAAGTEVEPNDSMARATVVAVGTSVSGSTHGSGYGDNDYFAVDVPKPGRVKLGLTFPADLGTGVAYDVDVYNAGGGHLYDFSVGGGAWDGSWLAAQGVFLPAGRSYVRIYGGDSRASWGKVYTLTVGWTAGTVELEPNDSTAVATVLALGSTVSGSTLGAGYGDNDYFAVDVPKPGRVKLGLTFPADLGTGVAYDVDVYNAGGGHLYDFSVGGGAWDGSWLAAQGVFLPAGRSYVRIYGGDSRASWGKVYTLTVGWTAGTVELEPNDSTAVATVLALGSTVSGSTLGAGYGDNDYYAVNLPQASPVTLTVIFPSNLGTGTVYNLYIYSADGDKLDEFDLTGADSNAKLNLSLPAGRNYIRIYGGDSRASWGKVYTLSVGYRWAATPAPTISGTAKVGSVLTANTGTWSPAPTSLNYQWYRSGKAISGATKRTLTLGGADLGTTITVAVKGVRAGYPAVTKTSGATAKVVAGTLTTAAPTISGSPKVGVTLTAVPGSWGPAPVKLAYQWYRSGKAISGATKATYVPAATDKAKKLTVKVTGTKAGFTTVTRASSSTKKVAAGTLVAPVPTIKGTARVGTVLTAAAGSWGPAPVTLTYRWYRSGKAISKATTASYTLTKSDKGKKITVRVTGTKAGYTKVVRKSAETAKVVP